MAKKVLTFQPDKVLLVIGNAPIVGWESMSIEMGMQYKYVKGIGGKGTKVSVRDKRAVITVSVGNTSEANTVFDAILEADYIYRGRVALDIMLKDVSGGGFITFRDGFLEGVPTVEFGREVTTFNYKINCEVIQHKIIGNAKVGGTPLDSLVDFAKDTIAGGFGGVKDKITGIFG